MIMLIVKKNCNFRQLFGIFGLLPGEFRRNVETKSQLLQFNFVHIRFPSGPSALHLLIYWSNTLHCYLFSKSRF